VRSRVGSESGCMDAWRRSGLLLLVGEIALVTGEAHEVSAYRRLGVVPWCMF